jgi:hypothetical protein
MQTCNNKDVDILILLQLPVGYDISPLKRVKLKKFNHKQSGEWLKFLRFFHHWFSEVKTP